MNKETFLKDELVNLIKQIDLSAKPEFGKMNVPQMIEHMSHAFQIASGKVVFVNKQTDELTAKMYRFMMSDRPFKDNTPNPNMSDKPLPLRYENIEDAYADLQIEISNFFKVFEQPDLRIANPFFGELNRQEQITLLYKHAFHHLRQFNHSKGLALG